MSIEKFSPDELLATGDNDMYDTSTASDAIALISKGMTANGVHYCCETHQWRVYDEKEGIWSKISHEAFKLYASTLYTRQVDANYNDMKPLKKAQLEEIWFKVAATSPMGGIWKPTVNSKVIPFKNYVLNLDTKVKTKFYKELYLESKLDRDYLPSAGTECPNWERLLNSIAGGDQFVVKTLNAFAFLAMAGRGRLERTILSLYSEIGGAGKGTYIGALLGLVGNDRSQTSDIVRLNDETTVSYFENKTFIAFPDEREVMSSRSNAYAKLLKLSSCDQITGRIVHSPNLYQYVSNALIIVASNIHLFPSDSAGSRRLLILKCVPPSEESVDINLGPKIADEYAQITNFLLEQFEWSIEKAQQQLIAAAKYPVFQNYAKENADETSTVNTFLKDMIIPVCSRFKEPLKIGAYNTMSEYHDSVIPYVSTKSLYDGYKNYLSDNNPGAKPLKKTLFLKAVYHYYRQNFSHELETVESVTVAGLKGKRERIKGLIFNPDTWIDLYASYTA